MKIKKYCFFGGFLQTQENWLNKMAEQGYRLVDVGKVWYEFELTDPHSFIYRVEFIAPKSKETVEEYVNLLEELGYKVFLKNMNFNYSIGKMRYRPWAEKGAKLATNTTTYNKEILIIEKEDDGKSFEIFTTLEDKILYYQSLRNPYLTLTGCLLLLVLFTRAYFWGLLGLFVLLPAMIYQYQICKLKKEAEIKEW